MSAIAASTIAIDTPERNGDIIVFPVAAATLIPAGVLVALNASGDAVNASDAASIRVIGRCEADVDNSAGSAGDLTVTVKRGVFKFTNSTDNAVDADDKGKICYVESNQAVAETSTNKCKAGRVIDVESDGVWVDTRYAHEVTSVVTDATTNGYFSGAAAPSALTSTDGTAAAASGSLANLAAEAEKIGDDVRALHAKYTLAVAELEKLADLTRALLLERQTAGAAV